MKMVGYLTNYPEVLSGERGIFYNYILASNGLFIEAENPIIFARIPVAECDIRGLALCKTKVALIYGSIPHRFFDLALDTFLATPDKEHYIAVTASGGYNFYVPVQDKNGARVTYEVGESVILELHSHGHMGARFSPKDNEDETGLKIYGVVGNLNATPVVRLRIGVYGYFKNLEWNDVFDGSLARAAEYEEEEVIAEDDIHSILESYATEVQHHNRGLWWNRWFRR